MNERVEKTDRSTPEGWWAAIEASNSRRDARNWCTDQLREEEHVDTARMPEMDMTARIQQQMELWAGARDRLGTIHNYTGRFFKDLSFSNDLTESYRADQLLEIAQILKVVSDRVPVILSQSGAYLNRGNLAVFKGGTRESYVHDRFAGEVTGVMDFVRSEFRRVIESDVMSQAESQVELRIDNLINTLDLKKAILKNSTNDSARGIEDEFPWKMVDGITAHMARELNGYLDLPNFQEHARAVQAMMKGEAGDLGPITAKLAEALAGLDSNPVIENVTGPANLDDAHRMNAAMGEIFSVYPDFDRRMVNELSKKMEVVLEKLPEKSKKVEFIRIMMAAAAVALDVQQESGWQAGETLDKYFQGKLADGEIEPAAVTMEAAVAIDRFVRAEVEKRLMPPESYTADEVDIFLREIGLRKAISVGLTHIDTIIPWQPDGSGQDSDLAKAIWSVGAGLTRSETDAMLTENGRMLAKVADEKARLLDLAEKNEAERLLLQQQIAEMNQRLTVLTTSGEEMRRLTEEAETLGKRLATVVSAEFQAKLDAGIKNSLGEALPAAGLTAEVFGNEKRLALLFAPGGVEAVLGFYGVAPEKIAEVRGVLNQLAQMAVTLDNPDLVKTAFVKKNIILEAVQQVLDEGGIGEKRAQLKRTMEGEASVAIDETLAADVDTFKTAASQITSAGK